MALTDVITFYEDRIFRVGKEQGSLLFFSDNGTTKKKVVGEFYLPKKMSSENAVKHLEEIFKRMKTNKEIEEWIERNIEQKKTSQ
jgi:hypothetical protein